MSVPPKTKKVKLMAPWPIVRSHSVKLTSAQGLKAIAVATALRLEYPQIDFPDNSTSAVSIGWRPGPTLYLEDHRGVDLVSETSAKAFEYRMLGLAGDGDAYLLSRNSDAAFETNLSDKIGLGEPQFINLDLGENPAADRLASACLKSEDAIAHLVKIARKAGRFNIAPYQVTDDVWALGVHIAGVSGCPVNIVGPNPKLSELANDKLWFTGLVDRLLGPKAIPQTFAGYNCVTAARHIYDLAKSHKKLVVKIPTSAGGLGNMTFLSKDTRNLSLTDVYQLLHEKLQDMAWSIGDPLLIGVWDDHVVSSPSVQLWIPASPEGSPVIEGIFAQAVKGNGGAFVGAQRTSLPKVLTQQITHEAMQIARVFQCLGYYGRLSLDTVLIDPPGSPSKIHWIEANARWGGVSIPMTIGNKITGRQKPSPILILQQMRKNDGQTPLSKKLTELGVSEISLPENNLKGFVRLLPRSEPLELIAAYGMDQAETEIATNF